MRRGGFCPVTGKIRIQFHHIIPYEKEFVITNNLFHSKVKEEVDKCAILHPLAHDLLHKELREIRRNRKMRRGEEFTRQEYIEHYNDFIKRHKGKTLDEIDDLLTNEDY